MRFAISRDRRVVFEADTKFELGGVELKRVRLVPANNTIAGVDRIMYGALGRTEQAADKMGLRLVGRGKVRSGELRVWAGSPAFMNGERVALSCIAFGSFEAYENYYGTAASYDAAARTVADVAVLEVPDGLALDNAGLDVVESWRAVHAFDKQRVIVRANAEAPRNGGRKLEPVTSSKSNTVRGRVHAANPVRSEPAWFLSAAAETFSLKRTRNQLMLLMYGTNEAFRCSKASPG